MNEIITLMNDGFRLGNINNLMRGENSEYAIFARKVRVGLAAAAGVAAAYIVYNNAEAVIERSSLLSRYAVESHQQYTLGMISLASGMASYAVTSYIGPIVCYAMMKLNKMIGCVIESSFRLTFMTLPYLIARIGISAAMEMFNNMIDGCRLILEWRRVSALITVAGSAMYIDPQTAWELLSNLYEAFEATDRNRSLMQTLCIASLLFICQIRFEDVKSAVQNLIFLIGFTCRREFYRLVSVLVVTGLFLYHMLDMDFNLLSELYRVITE